jgi:hypothetical protein
MKKNLLNFFIGIVATVVCNSIYSQTTYTWIGGNSAWTTATNWSPTRTIPATNDILRFSNGATNTITAVPTQTIGKLQIASNTNITLQTNTTGSSVLTVNTAASDAITVSSGSTLKLIGVRQGGNDYSLALTTANTAGLQANIDGTLTVAIGTSNRPATFGVFTKGGANATINFNAGSIYQHDVDGSSIPTSTWNTTSNCNITGVTSTAPSGLGQSFGNFTWDCPGHSTLVTLNSQLTTVNGDFTVKYAGQVQGVRTQNGLALSSNADLTLNIGGNFNVDHYAAEATWLMLTNGAANVIVNVTGNFNISKTGTGTCFFDYYVGTTLNSLVMNIAGNFNQTGGYFDWAFYPSATGSNYTVMNLYGNFSQTGTSTMITSTTDAGTPNGKIYFRKTGTQTIYASTPANVAYTNFDVQNNSTVELLSNLYVYSSTNAPWAGQFVVNNGGIIDAGTYQILSSTGSTAGSNNGFTLNSGAGIVTANINGVQNTTLGTISTSIANRTYSSGANYTYDGTALQNSGTFTTTPTLNQVNNLTINNTTGANTTGVTLQQEFKVANVCTFLEGVFTTTNTNILTINDNATIIGVDLDAGSTKYVNGPLKKVGNDVFTFPVGKMSHGCRPIYISAPSNVTDEFRAELIRGNAGLLGPITASGLQKVSGCEYWYLDRLVGTSNVNVSLSWSGESPCNAQSYVTDLPNLVVAHFNGTSWDTYGNDGGTTGDAVKGTVTWNYTGPYNASPTQTPWSLGSLLWWTNPLTVKFIHLQASEKNGQVKVVWANIAETGVDKYFVEYSTDGRNFNTINNTLARANSGDRTDYSWMHLTPANGNVFYRIKAIEFSGDITYSHIVRVIVGGKANNEFTVYPNPAKGGQITISTSSLTEGKYDIIILNTAGQKIMQRTLNHTGGSLSMEISLPENIKSGLYSIKLSGNEHDFVKPFLVQ